MAYDMDTAEIRRVALSVRRVGESVGDVSGSDLSAILGGLEGHFEGNAALALEEVLRELQGDLRQIQGGLSAISAELFAYAARIDAADRAAAEHIEAQ